MTEKLDIRRAVPTDANDLFVIRRDAIMSLAADYGHAAAERWASASPLDRAATKIATSSVWVAAFGAKVVGWVEVRGATIESLYVDPNAARTGVGSALLSHAEQHIRHETASAIAQLDASPNAEEFYARRGYLRDGDIKENNSIPMRKRLDRTSPDERSADGDEPGTISSSTCGGAIERRRSNRDPSSKGEPTMTPAKNTICLWFDGDAETAARFYAETFPDSSVTAVHRAPGDNPSGKQGDVLTVEFTVMGIPCIGLNGGPMFKHSEAFSFQVATADQAETDRYWNAIVGNGGAESQCGWCKDKWGLSWQITPIALTKAVTDPDRAAAKRAFDAMMKMKKIDVAAIEAARRG